MHRPLDFKTMPEYTIQYFQMQSLATVFAHRQGGWSRFINLVRKVSEGELILAEGIWAESIPVEKSAHENLFDMENRYF